MSRRLGISRGVVLAAFPVLLTQGLRARRTTLRLPEASGATGTVRASSMDTDGSEPLRLVVVGDSVAAGVGVEDHRDTVAGVLARKLLSTTGRPVSWTVVAQLGLTAGEVRRAVEGRVELADADVVLLSVGVNDAKNLHSDRRWRAELGDLLDHVLTAAPHAEVVLLGLPPMDQFLALPRALRELLGARARRIDLVGREVTALRPRLRRVEIEMVDVQTAFALDGFHPSAEVHALLADRVVQLVAPSLRV